MLPAGTRRRNDRCDTPASGGLPDTGTNGYPAKGAPPEQPPRPCRPRPKVIPSSPRRHEPPHRCRHPRALLPDEPARHSTVSKHQFVVLRLLTQGLSHTDIATATHMIEGTVKGHAIQVVARLGVERQTHRSRAHRLQRGARWRRALARPINAGHMVPAGRGLLTPGW
ncbi:LuxR C-terminal-related transcriptional regulator [Streptomyces sp. NPDC057543]|uniref:LuxR C-terminal-related transcriptional regulator n=1 Tax=Streptomyces sp. NPDC057543 TaxID=3346163 RepID=UPI0036C942EE